MIRMYDGDLIKDSSVDVICHQVNCQQVMGAGIAKQIHAMFPRVFDQYKAYCQKYRDIPRSDSASLFGRMRPRRGSSRTCLVRSITGAIDSKLTIPRCGTHCTSSQTTDF